MRRKDEEIRYRVQNQDATGAGAFERRRLELEMQMKELETKHQLLEEERDLERKVKRTALENDDARSQSTSARDKSPFNWTPKRRDVSDWASRIDNLLTPDRSTARIEITHEVNRQSHFSGYRSSRDRSSSVEDREVSPRAVLLRYNSGYAGNSSLPKLKLNNFDGNPLEWPEWSSMFIATRGHPSISLGNTNYNYNKLKQSFNHLSVLPNKSFNLMEVGIILGQDAYGLQRPLDYKIGTRSEPFAVLTELGWVVSGPMTGKRRQNVCQFAFTEDVKVAENIQTWRDIEAYASKINVVSQSKKELQAKKMLESTTKFTSERYEVRMLWSEPESNLPNNYSSALGQLYSLERRFQRDPNLKSLYQQSIDTDVEKGLVKILDDSEVKGTFGKEWYLPHHPVLNPNKPGKVRRVCNAASKYKDICLNDKLLAGPDLLLGLIGTIFRFREGPIALTANIESMFLQVQVPEQDRSCLRFLWRPRTNEPVQIYEYQRHVFGAKSSPTCLNYALKRVGLDNEKEYPIAAKAIQNNFYMDDFIRSVETRKKQEWYLPHHPVLNPNKPGKVRRVCNAASKYKDICLNDKLLAGPDLLLGLIGTIFRFREGPIALTANIESMFLQVQVPEQDRSCLRFLWRPRTNEPVQIYEYQRHVFGAKISPTCLNYALKRVGLDNEKEYPIAAKAIQNNFYMDDFIRSVETPEEARMVFATPSSAKPQQACQSKTCLQCRIKVQRHMPK